VINPKSILFVTLDSCRYDTFENANVPNMKKIGPLHKAKAPSNFTFGSHAAMFVGFTPGIATVNKSFINPKYAKIFKMVAGGYPGKGNEFITLEGENIIQGFNKLGYTTIGAGGVGWFDPNTETGRILGKDFQHFFYPGGTYYLEKQLEWINSKIQEANDNPLFIFINVGETHEPYYYKDAPWGPENSPCLPFSENNDADACKLRQAKSLEYVDQMLGPLLDEFSDKSILICSDHGDCWGEDGLWNHGFHHEMVLTVPLIIRLNSKPI